MDVKPSALMVTCRVRGALAERTQAEAERRFHGKEAMVMRESLVLYFKLRDALGFDFDRKIAELTDEPELEAVS